MGSPSGAGSTAHPQLAIANLNQTPPNQTTTRSKGQCPIHSSRDPMANTSSFSNQIERHRRGIRFHLTKAICGASLAVYSLAEDYAPTLQ